MQKGVITMRRIRTINKAVEELKAKDPDTAITSHFLRKLVNENEISCIMAGSRVLVDMDTVESYFDNCFNLEHIN